MKNIFFCNPTFSNKKFFGQLYFIFFLILYFYICSPILWASTINQFDNIKIKGKVTNNDEKINFSEKLDVVLLKYVLNKNGEVIPLGPQGRVKTIKNGNFEFINVVRDLKAGFQLGTRFKGELYSSKIFFMKEGDTSIEKNIIIPSVSYEIEKLRITNMSIVIESRLGKVLITEVLLLSNQSQGGINTSKNPFEIKLPKKIENFKMLSKTTKNSINHKIENNILKIDQIFQKGDTQIIYQYNLNALFGNLEINRKFAHSSEIIGIFTPIDGLQINSDMLIFSGKQKFEKTTYLAWKVRASDSNSIIIKISKIPSTSLQYFIVTIILLFLFSFTVLLFFKKRLIK